MFSRRPGATFSWCAAVLGTLTSTAGAATLLVPGDFPTIQEALNVVQEGDVILVADGVYTGPGNKFLFFPGPVGFTLRSENGPETCIIDLEGSGTAFFLVADEPPTAVIQGFTVRNGSELCGGAVFLHHDSDATFVNCVFTGNSASVGGAICAENDASATFIDCVIVGNTASFGGGGVYVWDNANPTFINCTIADNTANVFGGGVFVEPQGLGTTAFIGCSIVNNTAGGNGGGVFARFGSSAFSNCTITGNTAPLGFGGGVAAQGPSDVTIENSILWNNTAPGASELALLDDPSLGGASASVSFSDVEGGLAAVHVDPGSGLAWGAGNTAGGVGGALAVQGPGSVEVQSSILWQDAATAGAEIALLDDLSLGGASASVSFSDVEGGQAAVQVDPGSGLTWGAGNIDLDPLFVDAPAGDVRIGGDSPAVDAGDPGAVLDPAHPYDVLGFGHPRLDDGDFDDVEVVDMGATEFGGLLGNPLAAVGQTVELTLWGLPSAQYLLFASLPGGPVDLGAIGTGFLEPVLLTQLASGVLPAAGKATVLSSPAPGFAVGLTIGFQAVTSGPGAAQGPHLTNLETVEVTP